MGDPNNDAAIAAAMAEDEDDDPEEYVVETIRNKRKNPKTGGLEYLIKWENFPETDNTWEPMEHLKCPEVILKYEEQEKLKRKKRKAEKMARLGKSQQPATKRARTEASSSGKTAGRSEQIFLEDDEEDEDDEDDSNPNETQRTAQARSDRNRVDSNASDETTESNKVSGFAQGLPIDRILTASIGDDNKLYFVLKWQGRNELEMVEAEELEAKASLELCRWYRERLYWCIGDPSGGQDR